MQYQDELKSKRDQHLLTVCKVLGLPAVIVASLLMLVFMLLLIVTLFIPAFLCFREIGFKIWVGFAGAIMAIPFVTFCLAWAIIGLIQWLLLLPWCPGETHLSFLVGVPFMTALSISETLVSPGQASD